jgi:transposase
MIIEGRFNGGVFETFLKQMIKHGRQKIYFVTDGHPPHKTKKLNGWLDANKAGLEVFSLPPYSPELNPQGYVNQDVKTNLTGKKRPAGKEQMRNNVRGFMDERKRDKKQMQKCFHVSHVQYAA